MAKYSFQYTDEVERSSILDANSDKFLIEEQNHVEGNFLIFSDIKPLEIELQNIKNDNLILMDVLATMYEDMLAKGTV